MRRFLDILQLIYNFTLIIVGHSQEEIWTVGNILHILRELPLCGNVVLFIKASIYYV